MKEPLESVVCVLIHSVALPRMSLSRLLLRRKGIELKAFRHNVAMGVLRENVIVKLNQLGR